jgi:hypothetical protein
MRSFVILALAALSVAACTVRTETVQPAPYGRAVVTESATIAPPAIIVGTD